MSFERYIKEALRESLDKNLTVAVYRKPGNEVVEICGQVVPYTTSNVFKVTPWNKFSEDSVVLSIDNDEIITDGHCPAPLPGSTSESKYLNDLADVIDNLKITGGKTVISRTIHIDCSNVDWVRVAERLFDRFPDALCYFFFHPCLGAWMGATPELLLRSNESSHDFDTMALAGTKRAGEVWDDKNREEQQMVADYIVDVLKPLSEDLQVKPTETLRYGAIQHLCTRINGKIKDGVDRSSVLDRLSPTPAVGVYPKDAALADIARVENHERGCYGGYLTFSEHDSVESYVILRCIQFDETGFTAYAGSGITALSDPRKEWLETEAKAAPLIEIVESVVNERR